MTIHSHTTTTRTAWAPDGADELLDDLEAALQLSGVPLPLATRGQTVADGRGTPRPQCKKAWSKNGGILFE